MAHFEPLTGRGHTQVDSTISRDATKGEAVLQDGVLQSGPNVGPPLGIQQFPPTAIGASPPGIFPMSPPPPMQFMSARPPPGIGVEPLPGHPHDHPIPKRRRPRMQTPPPPPPLMYPSFGQLGPPPPPIYPPFGPPPPLTNLYTLGGGPEDEGKSKWKSALKSRKKSEKEVGKEDGEDGFVSCSDGEDEDREENDQFEPPPNLASIFARSAEVYLGLDLLGESDTAKLFSQILDDIERLQAHNKVLSTELGKARALGRVSSVSTLKRVSSVSTLTSEDAVDLGSEKPYMMTLHSVQCSRSHIHDCTLFEDVPKYIPERRYLDNSSPKLMLEGQEPIYDLGSFLRSKRNLAFVVTKFHSCQPDGKDSDCNEIDRLHIVSEDLRSAINRVAKCFYYDPGMEYNDEHPNIRAPYYFFFHHRKELAEMASEGSSTAEHVSVLMNFLDENFKEDWDDAEELFGRAMVNKKHLGKLFRPNQMVISCDEKAYVIERWPTSPHQTIHDVLAVSMWQWDFDGQKLVRRLKVSDKTMRLDSQETQDSEVPIIELPFYPKEYASEETLERIVNRGKKYWSMKIKYFGTYNGWDSRHEHHYANHRFMIDTLTHKRMHGTSILERYIEPPFPFDTWPTTFPVEAELDDSSLMLLPSTVSGYDLLEKTWVTINVDQISPIQWNKRAFERLVLDLDSKELINALVDVHVTTRKMDDIVSGKGNGLIILLHGSPGTGKTLTAESVAELAERPLYRVSCGDMGTTAQKVEQYLNLVFMLGKTWDCVILLDEADIYLEERTMSDMQRNSIVSVFLRILEYYEGIMILTSNRVGTFDEAFKSRIQVAMHYKPLTPASRKQIWRNFFDMLAEANEDVDLPALEARLDDLAREDMNGRQIRNALQTARQLAQFRKQTLEWVHLQRAIRTAGEFNKYLKNVHGHSDEQWAREERLR